MFGMSVFPPYLYRNVEVNVQSHKALKLKIIIAELLEH